MRKARSEQIGNEAAPQPVAGRRFASRHAPAPGCDDLAVTRGRSGKRVIQLGLVLVAAGLALTAWPRSTTVLGMVDNCGSLWSFRRRPGPFCTGVFERALEQTGFFIDLGLLVSAVGVGMWIASRLRERRRQKARKRSSLTEAWRD